MRIFKLAIISFVFFFLLITGFSLFIPSRVRISRALEMRAGRQELMTMLADPRQWRQWYPGADTMSELIVNGQLRGLVTGPGQTLEIIGHTDSSIQVLHAGEGQKERRMGWNILGGAGTNGVTVQWYLDFRLRWYPWEKFASLLFDKQYGTRMEQGLNNLKKIVENN